MLSPTMHQLSLAYNSVPQMDLNACTSNSVGNTLEFSMLSNTPSRVPSKTNIKLPQSQTSTPSPNHKIIDVKSVTFFNNSDSGKVSESMCSSPICNIDPLDDNAENNNSQKLNMHNQSSKSFGTKQAIDISTESNNILSNYNDKCPNMVCYKCKCKEILKQNKSALRIWSACYRINISNPNYKYDNREIEIAYFDGLYGKLSEYFQCEVDSTRIPSKYEIS
eukprot:256057_1